MKRRNLNCLIYRFLVAQMKCPKKNDRFCQAKKGLDELELNLYTIENMPTGKFKQLCNTNSNILAFKDVVSKRHKHKKVKHNMHESLKMLKYLKTNNGDCSVQERQYLFQCRMSDIDIFEN